MSETAKMLGLASRIKKPIPLAASQYWPCSSSPWRLLGAGYVHVGALGYAIIGIVGVVAVVTLIVTLVLAKAPRLSKPRVTTARVWWGATIR